MTDTIEAVSQAARDAAAAYRKTIDPPDNLRPINIRLGNADEGPTVQAFARFEREIIASHTKALIEQAGDDEAARWLFNLGLETSGASLSAVEGFVLGGAVFNMIELKALIERQTAAIAALRAEIERAKEEGVRAGIEAAASMADHLGGDRVERKDDGSLRSYDMDSKHGRGDATLNSMRVRAQTIATAIRALSVEAIAKGEK